MAKNLEAIEERENSYRVKIPYYEGSKRKYISKTFPFKKYGTKKNALNFAIKCRNELRVQVKNDSIVREIHYSLDDVFNQQMDIYNATVGTKKKVIGTYNKYIKSFIGGNRNFSSIKYDDIQKCLNAMVDIAKTDTIARAKAIWVRLYRYAIAKDIVIKDETYNVQTPKSNILSVKKSMSITDSNFISSIEMINNARINYREKQLIIGALLIMRYEGMRPSEVFALSKKDIDFNNMSIHVYKKIGTTSTEWNVITHAKTESSIRYIPLDYKLVSVFKKLFELTKGDYIFIRNNGQFFNGTYLSDMCRKYTNGLLRPYMLRHQFSTDLLIEGTDIRTIQELMGHTSSTMTIGYARSNDELKRKALDSRVLH